MCTVNPTERTVHTPILTRERLLRALRLYVVTCLALALLQALATCVGGDPEPQACFDPHEHDVVRVGNHDVKVPRQPCHSEVT